MSTAPLSTVPQSTAPPNPPRSSDKETPPC